MTSKVTRSSSTRRRSDLQYTFDIDNDTGLVTVTPPAGYFGEMEIMLGVRPVTSSDTADVYDSQIVSISVLEEEPASGALADAAFEEPESGALIDAALEEATRDA